MNSLRCIGLLLVVLLSACDAEKAPAPPAKASPQASPVTATHEASQAAAPVASPVAESVAKASDPVHEMSPNVTVVPVVAASKPDRVKPGPTKKEEGKKTTSAAAVEKNASSVNAKSAKLKADSAAVANRAPVARKSKPASQVVKETRLPKASLDLSLPPEMVKQLTPPKGVITASNKPKTPPVGAKPLLPKMFSDTESDPDFQLQGRLLSNEMQLQLRNESRREVEGAALDFKFKQ